MQLALGFNQGLWVMMGIHGACKVSPEVVVAKESPVDDVQQDETEREGWEVEILRNTAGDWKTKIKYKTSGALEDPWNNLTTFSSGFSYMENFWLPFDFPKSSQRGFLNTLGDEWNHPDPK